MRKLYQLWPVLLPFLGALVFLAFNARYEQQATVIPTCYKELSVLYPTQAKTIDAAMQDGVLTNHECKVIEDELARNLDREQKKRNAEDIERYHRVRAGLPVDGDN